MSVEINMESKNSYIQSMFAFSFGLIKIITTFEIDHIIKCNEIGFASNFYISNICVKMSAIK